MRKKFPTSLPRLKEKLKVPPLDKIFLWIDNSFNATGRIGTVVTDKGIYFVPSFAFGRADFISWNDFMKGTLHKENQILLDNKSFTEQHSFPDNEIFEFWQGLQNYLRSYSQ